MFRFLALLVVPVFLALPVAAQDKGYAPFVSKAKAVLTKDFKDPNGAQYRNLGVYRDIGGKDLVLCGEVNGRNSFGAMVGFRPFYATAKNASIKEGPEDSLFDTLSQAYCEKRLAPAS